MSCAQKLCYASRAEARGIYKNRSGTHTDRLSWSICAPLKKRRDEKQSPTTRSQSTKTTFFCSNRILSRWHNAASARTTNPNPSPKSDMIFAVAADSFDAMRCVCYLHTSGSAEMIWSFVRLSRFLLYDMSPIARDRFKLSFTRPTLDTCPPAACVIEENRTEQNTNRTST